MKKDPLPAEFAAFVKGYAASQQFTSPRRLFRALIFRWCLWRDGNQGNELPGYTACPDEDPRTGFPRGWSQRKIADLCREAIGTATIRTARKAAASIRQDCGSGQDYGICKVCGKGHGYSLIRNGKPTALVTAL